MNVKPVWLTFLVAILVSGQAIQRGMSPVPPWDGFEGRIPGEYVYVDLKTGEYLIHYPEDLQTATEQGREPTSSSHVTVRWAEHLSEPIVDATVSRTSEGFKYDYTVGNQVGAKQSIRSFKLVTASTDYTGRLADSASDPWITNPTTEHMRPRFEQAALSPLGMSNKGMFVWWSARNEDQRIAPGSIRSGFALTSQFSPGFTTAYVASGESLRVADTLPEKVRAQLKPLGPDRYRYKTVLTVGPRFQSDAPVELVASDWMGMIRRLQVTGEISESTYAAAILSSLRSTAESGFVPATKASYPEPQTALERLIADGLRLSLGL
jgi:hypothetical protein